MCERVCVCVCVCVHVARAAELNIRGGSSRWLCVCVSCV